MSFSKISDVFDHSTKNSLEEEFNFNQILTGYPSHILTRDTGHSY